MTKPEIYFYIPKEKYSDRWPKSFVDNWEAFGGGANIWSYFTPIAWREYGYPVQITTELPDEGIVLSHSQNLPQKRITNDKTLLICIRVDYGRNHPAQMHLVQNADQAHYARRDMIEYLFQPGPSYYIPQWPQPGLVPRDTERGDRFENIVFVGARQNLAPELITDGWRQSREELSLNFVTKFDRASWHDYSEADAVIAIRSMSNTRYFRKPPSKLTNAWLAGVTAILGRSRRSGRFFRQNMTTSRFRLSRERLPLSAGLRKILCCAGQWSKSAGLVAANTRLQRTPIAGSRYSSNSPSLTTSNGAPTHGVINTSTAQLETSASGSRTHESDRA